MFLSILCHFPLDKKFVMQKRKETEITCTQAPYTRIKHVVARQDGKNCNLELRYLNKKFWEELIRVLSQHKHFIWSTWT
jgi:hypothetical protein